MPDSDALRKSALLPSVLLPGTPARPALLSHPYLGPSPDDYFTTRLRITNPPRFSKRDRTSERSILPRRYSPCSTSVLKEPKMKDESHGHCIIALAHSFATSKTLALLFSRDSTHCRKHPGGVRPILLTPYPHFVSVNSALSATDPCPHRRSRPCRDPVGVLIPIP